MYRSGKTVMVMLIYDKGEMLYRQNYLEVLPKESCDADEDVDRSRFRRHACFAGVSLSSTTLLALSLSSSLSSLPFPSCVSRIVIASTGTWSVAGVVELACSLPLVFLCLVLCKSRVSFLTASSAWRLWRRAHLCS